MSGWMKYTWTVPSDRSLPIEFKQCGLRWIGCTAELPDEMNVSDLYWRPTGIFTEFGGEAVAVAQQSYYAINTGLLDAILAGQGFFSQGRFLD